MSDESQSEVDFDAEFVRLALNARKVRKRILSSSESEDADVNSEKTLCEDINWSYKNLKPKIHKFNSNYSGMKVYLARSSTPLHYFQLFFSEELVTRILEKTINYRKYKMNNDTHSFKNNYEHEPTLNELFRFFAIRLLMSRVKKVHDSEYWTKDTYLRTDIFEQTMDRHRYAFLFHMLHFSDVATDNSNRLIKIGDIVDKLRSSFKNCFYPYRNLCIDKGLLLSNGRLAFEQYIPYKRDKCGIKSFVLCDCKTGYIQDFIVYKGCNFDVAKNQALGKSGLVVLTLLRPYLGKGHRLFVDNLYTSPMLFSLLHENKTNACGLVKCRRKHMPKMDEKLKKGEICFRSANNLLALKWHDKREMYILSTCHSARFVHTKEINYRTNEIILKPSCIVDYNLHMSAVDNTNRVISNVETIRKNTKWYKKFFFHLLDVAVWNAYCLYKVNTKRKVTMRKFHLRLIKEILQKYQVVKNNCKICEKPIVDQSVRLRERHFPSVCGSDKIKKALRNCVVCSKNDVRRRSRYECHECDVGLCVVPCFRIYHTQMYY